MWEVLRDGKPVARKPHPCDTCGRRIEVGEWYRRAEGVGDDGWETWKDCQHCITLLRVVWEFDPWDHDGISLWDYVCDYASSDGPLYVGMRGRWVGVDVVEVQALALAAFGWQEGPRRRP